MREPTAVRSIRIVGGAGTPPVPAAAAWERDVPMTVGVNFLSIVNADTNGVTIAFPDVCKTRDTPDPASGEYEDEFLWARCLQHLAGAGRAGPSALQPVLARLAASEGREAQVAFVRALLGRDPKMLAEAFDRALAEHESEIEERARSFTTPVTSFAPHRFVWLEGLALLRLAERAGLPLDGDHRYCPRLARLRATPPYDGDWALPTGLEA